MFSDWGMKAHRKQHGDLRQDDQLTPVDLFHVLEAAVDAFRRENSRHKGQNGNQIPQAVVPGPLKQIGAEQHNVAGLGVGKNAAPADR